MNQRQISLCASLIAVPRGYPRTNKLNSRLF
nr:MAG TPA: hypothetical protein [Caudoviricetes sp.]